MRVALVFFFLSRRRSWRSCSVLCRNRLRSSSLRCWPPKLICLRPEPGAWLRNMAAIKGLYNLKPWVSMQPSNRRCRLQSVALLQGACRFSSSSLLLYLAANYVSILHLFFPFADNASRKLAKKEKNKEKNKSRVFLFKERRGRQEMRRHRFRSVLPMMAMLGGTSRRRWR